MYISVPDIACTPSPIWVNDIPYLQRILLYICIVVVFQSIADRSIIIVDSGVKSAKMVVNYRSIKPLESLMPGRLKSQTIGRSCIQFLNLELLFESFVQYFWTFGR